MMKRVLALTGALLLSPASLSSASAASSLSQEDANAIAEEAYTYLYSLVTMDLTRQQFTNVEEVKAFSGPMNVFVNVPGYPTAEMKTVVRPNFDTLYSSAWLDLTKGPMVISVPDTNGRYYLLPMLDMWTDVFASPGWRTTGTGAQTFLITPPVGRARFRTASARSRHPRRMCGLSAASRRTDLRITTRSTKFKPA